MTTATATTPRRIPFTRVGPGRALRNGLTLAWRNVTQLRHSPEKLMDATMVPIMFLVLFLWVFGGAVSGSGDDYLQKLVPGLMAQMAMFTTIGLGATMSQDIQKGVFDRFRSLPIARSAPLVGAVLGDTVRFVISMVALTVIGSLLGFRFHAGPLSILAAYALAYVAYLAFCWLSLLVGLLAPSPATAQGLTVVWTLPLTFGSSVLIPDVGTMPGWLQVWAKANPVTHLAESLRALTVGGPLGNHLWIALAWAAAIVVAAFPAALWVYGRRV